MPTVFGEKSDIVRYSDEYLVISPLRPEETTLKVSGGSRSDRGARDFARVYSVLESQRKKGKLPFRTDPG